MLIHTVTDPSPNLVDRTKIDRDPCGRLGKMLAYPATKKARKTKYLLRSDWPAAEPVECRIKFSNENPLRCGLSSKFFENLLK